MNDSYELVELANHGVAFLGLAASAASLIACIIYRRASPSMILLILAFAGDVVVMFLYLLLGLANQFMVDFLSENLGALYLLVGLFSVAAGVLTAVGLFQVLGDVVRRLDRYRAGGPDDDYGRPRTAFDEGDDLRWERRPGGPDFRR